MEKLKLEVEILKTKILVFITIAGGSWVYGIKYIDNIFGGIILVIFTVSAFSIFKNLMYLGIIHKKIKEENE